MKPTVLKTTLLAFALTACGQLSQSDCEKGDWFGIGQIDGVRGRSADFVERHVESCSRYGVAADTGMWEAGRQKGLRVFCTAQSQYEAGRSGRSFKDICAVENLPVHYEAFEKGRRYHELTRRIESLRAELSGLRRQTNTKGGASQARLMLDYLLLRTDIDRLLLERRAYASL